MPAAIAALALAGCGALPHKVAPQAAVVHPKANDLPVLPPAGSGRGGYYLDDGPGDSPPAGLRDVPDAVAKAEPLSKFANRPYVVFGTSYVPMAANAPFSQRGTASWYGKKFHGQRTSSGELYDMYKMTAAHPTLPIPSYARITSLTTGAQVVVRINDRGPFHSTRIVDVSYTAALKLGLLGKGSHEVLLERVLPGEPVRSAAAAEKPEKSEKPGLTPVLESLAEAGAATHPLTAELQAAPAPARAPTDGYYLQLGAFSQAANAAEMRGRVLASGVVKVVEVVQAGLVHRLYGGPFASRAEALAAAGALPAALAIKPLVVRRSAD